jgi:protein-S-isoprenylcysteine O-methyltransferase
MKRMASGESSASPSSSLSVDVSEESSPQDTLADLRPGGKLSLASISTEGYALGNLTSLGLALSFYCIFVSPSNLWRPPLFVSVLGVFHFFEFYTYARWNTTHTTAESYLTLSNGKAYILAMAFAFLETTISSFFFPDWQQLWSYPLIQAIGGLLLAAGQWARHSAIATAGTSFNHKVQRHLKDDHVLVTNGIYHYLRHPSYFGFYWWAVGTQLLLGNVFSTPIFSVILWRFFFLRIPGECALARPVSHARALALNGADHEIWHEVVYLAVN